MELKKKKKEDFYKFYKSSKMNVIAPRDGSAFNKLMSSSALWV